MSSIKLSIITINYNNAGGLKSTVLSVLNQTYQDFEYLIIDGGSSDGSLNVIQTYSSRINYWISENDKGIYHAMNKGISKANGRYLFFLNSGDTFFSKDIVKEFLESENDEDLLYGDINFIDSSGGHRVEKNPEKLSFLHFFQRGICHQCIFTNRRCFEKLGMFDENLKIAADWKFLITGICLNNFSYKHIPLTIANFSTDGISFSDKHTTIIREEKNQVLKSQFPLFFDDYQSYSSLYYLKYSRIFKLLKLLGFYRSINF